MADKDTTNKASGSARPPGKVRRPRALINLGLGLLLLLALLASLTVGRYALSFDSLLAGDRTTWDVLLFMRLPRIAAAALIGAALAGAG